MFAVVPPPTVRTVLDEPLSGTSEILGVPPIVVECRALLLESTHVLRAVLRV